jgi:hypothetical protein
MSGCIGKGGDKFIFKGLPDCFVSCHHRAIVYGRLEGACFVSDPVVDLWSFHVGQAHHYSIVWVGHHRVELVYRSV